MNLFFSKQTPKAGGYLSIQDGNGHTKTEFLVDGLFDFLNKVNSFVSCRLIHNSNA